MSDKKMKTLKITNGKKTLDVTEKAFKVVFEPAGYKPTEEKKTPKK